MTKLTWYFYKEPYNKNLFYQKMGPFFSERQYQGKFPYLVNSPKTSWFVLENEDYQIVGFSSFEEKVRGVEIGEVYIVEGFGELWKSLASKTIREAKKLKPRILFTAVTSNEEAAFYLYKGFRVHKTSKNYIYLEMGVPEQ
ncbi:hypothetical protein ACJX4N_002515 [Enterococcus faecalis]|uniref:hypothetical protein n=1 Tax=Enterococcus faecalis TaxID=1351 RepID=UPI0012E1458E|nr:hypothetical protein [Enterococcus faecalis]EGO5016475.1 hypothetical protein [Enterococcus faecalis]EGO6561346.1 hypothetical protein [Enterococcus faecalis]EGO7560947.1 hypothetical protein [Enterococcus faecalis]EGO7742719.1 hypothetical protein [Enterococcus faecalis]EGO8387404.1 hypothetical protein [Enterococcus faecalis]